MHAPFHELDTFEDKGRAQRVSGLSPTRLE